MLGKAKALKNKVIDVTSNVLSAPARLKEEATRVRADREIGVIKDRRAFKRDGVKVPNKVEAVYQDIKRKRSHG